MEGEFSAKIKLGEAPDRHVIDTASRTVLLSFIIMGVTLVALAVIWAVVQMNAPPQPSEPRRTEAGAGIAAIGAPRTTSRSVQGST